MLDTILVVDDEEEILISCQKILEEEGYSVLTAETGEEAMELLSQQPCVLMLLDLNLPGLSGMQILKLSRSQAPDTYVVIFTAYAAVSSAVEAIKSGAFDYLAKPFTDDQLLLAVRQALEHRDLSVENTRLKEQLTERFCFENIIGSSPPMRRIFYLLSKVADSDASILITGESGTGKDLVARAIHACSARNSRPFVPVDCASLPDNLLESELFGHEKGAFTGANKVKRGLLEMADTGTVFLDEIGDLPISLQPKLLRTLQERELRRIGGDRAISIDVRVLAATNHDLQQEVSQGRFREELLYRLNVVDVGLPPLRKRSEDIPLLSHYFLKALSKQYKKPVDSFSPDVIRCFHLHSWPGNVRELQNVIERAILISNGTSIEIQDLPEALTVGAHPSPSLKTVRQEAALTVEKPFLIDLLQRHQGNVSTASAEAKVPRKTIYRTAKKFNINIASFRKT